MMNNKSGVGWHELVAQSNVKRRKCLSSPRLSHFEEINQFSHLDCCFLSCFFEIFIFTLTHDTSPLRVWMFLMGKTIDNIGSEDAGKFDFVSRWAEWLQRGRKKIAKLESLASNYWALYMTRQHEIESKCRRYSVIYRCGACDWKKRRNWRKLRWFSRCHFVSYLFAYIEELFPFRHFSALSLLCVWYLRK